MGAGFVGRQRLSLHWRKLIGVCVARRVADRSHTHLDEAIGRVCRPHLTRCGRRSIHRCVSRGSASLIGHRSSFVNYHTSDMLASRAIQRAENRVDAPRRVRLPRAEARPERKRDACRPAPREEKVKGSPKAISLRVLALSLSLVPVLGTGPAGAQPPPSWLDPVLLPAAKAEGSLIVYSSTNEQEG